jgi:hypothetical protein
MEQMFLLTAVPMELDAAPGSGAYIKMPMLCYLSIFNGSGMLLTGFEGSPVLMCHVF